MVEQTRWVFLFMQAVPCSYFCKHCFFAPTKNYKVVPYEQIIQRMQPFVDLRGNERSLYGNIAAHLDDCALNHPDLPSWVAYLKLHHVEGWQSIPADGFRRRTNEQWSSYLRVIKAAGTEIFEFTLYGGKPTTHDWFTGRKGSYAAIHSLAKMWHAVGGKTLWSLFIHKNNLQELGEIRNSIRNDYQTECPVRLWSFSGWGATQDELRIEKRDLELVDPFIRNELRDIRSEAEWVKELSNTDEPAFPKDPQVIRLVIDGSGQVKIPYTKATGGLDGIACGCSSTDAVDKIMNQWQKAYDTWRNWYPNTGVLCQEYGNSNNEKLYDRGSMIRKWGGAYEVMHRST
jgi:hypothetical protein